MKGLISLRLHPISFIKPAQHIFLTGFMGSGKTTLGKKLAPLFGLPFINLDSYIEEQEKQSIPEIFETQGESAFRQIELTCLREIIKHQPCVISLGGGTICFNNNLELVKNNGLLIYLDLPASVLADRLKQAKEERPLFKGIPEQELAQKIKELLEQRLVYYQQAHLTVNGLNLIPKVLHKQIVEFQQK